MEAKDVKVAEEIAVFPGGIKIRYKGLFDFEGIYKSVYAWIRSRKFKYFEPRYKDKLDTAWGNEIEIECEGEKKVTEYLKYVVEVKYHLWESREVQVVIGGNKVKRMQGRIEIRMSGKVITNWQGRYSKDKLSHRLMQKFLNEVLLKREISLKHVDPFEKDLLRLAEEIKKRLGSESS